MLHEPPSVEAQAQACRAQRMEIVGQLAGGIVHDFNNILTVITGTIEILAEAVADRPELARIARMIDEAAARGADLTSHLLAFARGQPSQPRDVDVNALLVDAARLLRPTLGEAIEICSVPATGVAAAWVDPSLLMTAILDLAIAARDATQDSKLTLEIRSAAAGESCACAGSEISATDYVAIAVSVSAAGISDGCQSQVFADIGKTRDFVAQANGLIEVRRAADGVTSVEIYLPRTAGLVRRAVEDSDNAGIARDDEPCSSPRSETLLQARSG